MFPIPLEEVGGKVLDMGCGYGVFGIVLNRLLSCSVDMVDVNLRALHLAEINIKENHCSDIRAFESNVYENINSKYTCIVTNPPIRAGKKVVYDILMNARNYLEKNGVQKQYTVEILTKKKGFYILKCKSLSNN